MLACISRRWFAEPVTPPLTTVIHAERLTALMAALYAGSCCSSGSGPPSEVGGSAQPSFPVIQLRADNRSTAVSFCRGFADGLEIRRYALLTTIFMV
ncbi:hypothetical protein KCP73_14535 [Salmonella enterica subsp. enterica]|nr:hypothetical protein KCP73_14535 [Salmonella enterica subsp. enterica]